MISPTRQPLPPTHQFAAAPNRFIDDFFDLITLIFHYHYSGINGSERQRNEVAIREHHHYIEALRSRSPGSWSLRAERTSHRRRKP
jgi:DNA-binding GntR family transcriptional regulator